jgi:NAD-dependent deacetylase sirtuin 5
MVCYFISLSKGGIVTRFLLSLVFLSHSPHLIRPLLKKVLRSYPPNTIPGLSQRANHPREQLKLLHGSLFDIKCFNCSRIELNFDDPFHPSLEITSGEDDRLAASSNTMSSRIAQMDPETPPTIPVADLPECPKCKTGLLRPGVVWFGESLPEDTLKEIDEWIEEKPIDLCLVIGTTATVYPAAGYVQEARQAGARIVVINMDSEELGAASWLRNRDFLFEGDASKILPEILKPIIGELDSEGGVKDAAEA